MLPTGIISIHRTVAIPESAFNSGRIEADKLSRSENLFRRLAPAPLLDKSGQNLRAFDPACAR